MFAVFRRHGRGSIALTIVEIYLANCESLVSSSLPISSYTLCIVYITQIILAAIFLRADSYNCLLLKDQVWYQ